MKFLLEKIEKMTRPRSGLEFAGANGAQAGRFSEADCVAEPQIDLARPNQRETPVTTFADAETAAEWPSEADPTTSDAGADGPEDPEPVADRGFDLASAFEAEDLDDGVEETEPDLGTDRFAAASPGRAAARDIFLFGKEKAEARDHQPLRIAEAGPRLASAAEATAPAAVAEGRRAGRVKTRLLGFQPLHDAARDVFGTAKKTASAADMTFPVGWIVVVEGPGRGASFTLQTGVSQIGRGEDQAIRLDFGDMTISRDNHAALAYDDEQKRFFLGYGGKSNLVRLNGRPVLGTEDLADADLIRIGETTLRFAAFCGPDFSWDPKPVAEPNRTAID